MKLNICSLLFFLAKLVSLEVERLPNAANIILPKSFCQLTPCSICRGDCEGDDSAAPVWSRLKPGSVVRWGFGGNHVLPERWGLLSNLSMCKTHSCVWVLKLVEKLGETPETDWKVCIGLPKEKALLLCLKVEWETTGTSWCPWVVCWPLGSETAPNGD